MRISVQELQSEEYYLEYGVWEHACRIIPPQHGSIECDVCGNVIVDDYDYSDELRDAEECQYLY